MTEMSAEKAKDGSFQSDLGALLESGEGADVTLVVGASRLPAHSFILAARSSVFAAMLRNDMREASSRQIEISDVQEDVVQQLLCFMYTDVVPQIANLAAELLAAADKYDLPLLKKKCEEEMARNLSVDSAAATAVLAVLHSCSGLKSAAVDFIANHPEVVTSDGWTNVLRRNAEASAEICTLVAEATLKLRRTSVEQTQDLAERLLEAARTGQVDNLRTLLPAGAPVDARDSNGCTALHLAVMQAGAETSPFHLNSHRTPDVTIEAVKCLLNAGANVNAQDSSQQTPLHAAAFRGSVKILWALLVASATVDAKDRWGKTPLHWAVAANNEEAVRTLMLAGAGRSIGDHKRISPIDAATQSVKEIMYKY